MNLTCLIGKHNWNDCKCTKCGRTRNQCHNWSGCKCSKCGKTRDEEHDWSASFKCPKCGKEATIEFIKTSLMDSALRGSTDQVIRALDVGADPNQEIEVRVKPGSFRGLAIGSFLETLPIKKNPLIVAVENGHAEIARILMRRGARLRVEHGENPWEDVLLNAAKLDRIDIATLALDQGANINCCGLHSTTPLILASAFGRVAMVKLLLSKGADHTCWSTHPMQPSRRGRTALMWADSEGHKEVVRILTESGASQ